MRVSGPVYNVLMKIAWFLSGLLLLNSLHLSETANPATSLRFEVTAARGLIAGAIQGRLFVMLNQARDPDPRFTAGETGMQAPPRFAKDVDHFRAGSTETIDASAIAFPMESLSELPAGDYFVQAVFDSNIDLRQLDAPGNLYSLPQNMHLDPAKSETIQIQLTEQVPAEHLPQEDRYVKYVRLPSPLLSSFHRRTIYLRAGIILPRDYDSTNEKYPLRIHIGGYGDKFTNVQQLMEEGSDFRKTWLADGTPQMIFVHLDGDGPYGDCYQVNSANNGPYGDALTKELIPYIEKRFRAVGTPRARVLDGGSTGGWVSLALQIFYPDYFNGTWSGYPDSVDFRAYQLVNIYEDENAYVNEYGFERPSERQADGDIKYTMRHECQMENVLGRGNSYTMSGNPWGAWNAVYGPSGKDGLPVPIWDPQTGKINHEVAEQWKKYDLRLILQTNWKTLAPKLTSKIHIWVGDADNFFLNNAVHLLDQFFKTADPPFQGTIVYGPGQGHGWEPYTELELMEQMMNAIRATEGSSLR
jgi:Putative esterase